MAGSRRNPLSVSNVLEKVGEKVHNAKADTKTREKQIAESVRMFVGEEKSYVDVQIQFIGASGLPKMDVMGTADPYFVAKIDDKIQLVSSVVPETLAPVWNELWRVKNVPSDAELKVEVFDKDEDTPHDDYIGKFKLTLSPGAKEAEIEGPVTVLRKSRGTFWLKIDSTPTKPSPKYPYLFDGPIRYSRHFSPTVGRLTNLPADPNAATSDTARLYSTWKVFLKGVELFFRDTHQHWNTNYKAAQSIFQGPTSIAVRHGIQAGHKMLYARTGRNKFGVIEDAGGILEIMHGGRARAGPEGDSNAQFLHRVKPAVYTYIISSDDDSFRFSETGAAFFVDFASKHALHSNCSPTVRYSGEFHPRPKGGWANFNDGMSDKDVEWEFLKELLEYNFPGLGVVALDREDPRLVESREATRAYAVNVRGVEVEELQPHAGKGEETLHHQASVKEMKDDVVDGAETGRKGTLDFLKPVLGKKRSSCLGMPDEPVSTL
ncbi:hypothetical protein BDQ17DRAFT_1406697 [Cyathus striatus]|nr:hypothetical protein BDQ17DRAFT_1406697 [Cyathus striatus]